MNQHQRKFLLEQIESQYKAEKSELNKRRPVAPNLNNYLTAAILDGSVVMRDAAGVRDAIRKRVRDLGKTESLMVGSDRWGSEEHYDMIKLPAVVLFELPDSYNVVLKQHEEALEKWNSEMRALESSINAMRIKVQVGSDKALAALVDQADQLCSMSLTASSKLLLPSSV